MFAFASPSSLRLRIGAASLTLLAAACSAAPEHGPHASDAEEAVGTHADALSVTSEWTDGMTAGGGYDLVAGDPRGTCVQATPLTLGAPALGGASTTWKIRYVEDYESLRNELGVSASASVKAPGYQVSAKVDYFRSKRATSFHAYAIVSVQVQLPMQLMAPTALLSAPAGAPYLGPAELVANGRIEEFRRKCGDAYVRGVQGGGELIGVFEVEASSKQELEKTSVEIKGKAGTFSGSASFRQSFESVAAHRASTFTAFKLGGNPAVPAKSTPSEFIDQALAFEADVTSNPAAVRALLADYEALLNYQGPSPVRIERQLRVLNELDRSRLLAQTRLGDIEYVTTHPEQFAGPVDGAALQAGADGLRRVLNQIDDAVVSCTENVNACAIPENLAVPVVTLPSWSGTVAPPDPRGAPLFGPTAICGVAHFASRAEAPCKEIPGTPIVEANADACGTDPVMGTVSDSRCPVLRANTCANIGCPGSIAGGDRFLGFRTCGPNAVAMGRPDSEGMVECKTVERLKTCTNASLCGVAEYASCSVVVAQQAKTCEVGRTPTTYERCEDVAFGVAEYKSCWHYADGSAYSGPPPATP